MRDNIERVDIWKSLYFLAIAALIPLMGLQDLSGDVGKSQRTAIWSPSLPLNSTVFDYINVIFIFVSVLWLVLGRKRIALIVPYPLLVILTGSLVAMLNGQAITANLTYIIQDIYLVLFFWIVYNVTDSRADLRRLVLLWMAVSVLEALLILGFFAANPLTRAYGTLDDANGAGLYLGISFFLLLQPYVRIGGFRKLVFALVILVAIFATKSLGALIAFPISAALVFIVYWRRAGSVKRVRLGLAALALAVVSIMVIPQALEMHNILDRAQGSAGGRRAIWEAGLQSFMSSPLGIGVGPGGFSEEHMIAGGTWGAAHHAELHNDYLAYLVERGVIGFTGLVLLLSSFGAMLWGNMKAARSEREILWGAGLCGMLCFALIDAMFHEVMHARYVWLLFALIAAENKLARNHWVAARVSGSTTSAIPAGT